MLLSAPSSTPTKSRYDQEKILFPKTTQVVPHLRASNPLRRPLIHLPGMMMTRRSLLSLLTDLGKTSSVYFEKEVVASIPPELPSRKESLNTQRETIRRKLLGSPPQKTLAPVIETATKWTCRTCTFTNPSNCTFCSMCVTKFPAPRSTMGVFAVVPQANIRPPRQVERQQPIIDERDASVTTFNQLSIEREDRNKIASVSQEVVQPTTGPRKQDSKTPVVREAEFDKAESLRLARSLLPDLSKRPKQLGGFKLTKNSKKIFSA